MKDAPPGATSASLWRPLVTGREKDRVLAVALDVARRLADPGKVSEAIRLGRATTAYPRSAHWSPHTVGQGHAGHAVLFGAIDACFPGEGWEKLAHERLSEACGSVTDWNGLPPGLYAGVAGLTFTAHGLSRGGTRYGKLLGTLKPLLARRSMELCAQSPAASGGCTVHSWDLISGLSGIGLSLLTVSDGTADDPALAAVLDRLIALCDADQDPPAWRTPAELIADDGMRRTFPRGNLNCGLAHGLPGALSTLALASRAGVRRPRLDETVATVAGWLSTRRSDDSWGPNWPSAFSTDAKAPAPKPTHAGWCYGSPGVGRSLWHAGQALDDSNLRRLAEEALSAVALRPASARGLVSPTFCHGTAGLLHLSWRAAQETGNPILEKLARSSLADLLDQYKPDSVLGFQAGEGGGRFIEQPGLLDGAPGAALALLAAATDVEPAWDRLFAVF